VHSSWFWRKEIRAIPVLLASSLINYYIQASDPCPGCLVKYICFRTTVFPYSIKGESVANWNRQWTHLSDQLTTILSILYSPCLKSKFVLDYTLSSMSSIERKTFIPMRRHVTVNQDPPSLDPLRETQILSRKYDYLCRNITFSLKLTTNSLLCSGVSALYMVVTAPTTSRHQETQASLLLVSQLSQPTL